MLRGDGAIRCQRAVRRGARLNRPRLVRGACGTHRIRIAYAFQRVAATPVVIVVKRCEHGEVDSQTDLHDDESSDMNTQRQRETDNQVDEAFANKTS